MQRRGPAPHLVRLHRAQRHLRFDREALQPHERVAVQCERARREPALDLQVFEVVQEVGIDDAALGVGLRIRPARFVHRGAARAWRRRPVQGLGGSSRDSAALAISPTRLRNSVPMSAV